MTIHWQTLKKADKIEAVKTVWQAGFSASDIAAHFDGATRNAICGLYTKNRDKLTDTPLRTGRKATKTRNHQWSAAERARVITALRAGATSSQIGAMVGMSRNAVSGRVLRDKELRAIGFGGKAGARVYSFGQAAPKVPVKPTKFAPTAFDVATRNVPLMVLEANECRWPVNAPAPGEEHLFCGLEANGSYCAHHAGRSAGGQPS